MTANLLLSCFKTLFTPLTREERRTWRSQVAANFKPFNLSLVHVMNVSTACNALCLKPNAPDAGFIFMNTLALWMQLLGSVILCLFNAWCETLDAKHCMRNSLDQAISWFVFSYLVAYMLYFFVIVSQKEGLMAVAIGLFLPLYALSSLVFVIAEIEHTVSSLVFVIPPLLLLVYGIKTLACGYCAFYAYQIRDRISGAEQITEQIPAVH